MSFVGMWFGIGQNEHFDRGFAAYEQKRYAEAAAHFAQAVETENNDRLREKSISYLAGCLARMGSESLKKNQAEDALNNLREAAALRPRYADVQLNLGMACYAMGRIEDAMGHIAEAKRINPNYALARLRLGALMMIHGEHEEGCKEAQSAAERAGLMELDELKEACHMVEDGRYIEAGKKLMTLDPGRPGDIPAFLEAGDRAMRTHQYADAEVEYRRAIEVAPSFADLHVRLGQALYEKGEVEESLACYAEALRCNPMFADAHSLMGISLRRMGRESDAQDAFKQALAIDPHNIIASSELSPE